MNSFDQDPLHKISDSPAKSALEVEAERVECLKLHKLTKFPKLSTSDSLQVFLIQLEIVELVTSLEK